MNHGLDLVNVVALGVGEDKRCAGYVNQVDFIA